MGKLRRGLAVSVPAGVAEMLEQVELMERWEGVEAYAAYLPE